MGLQIQVYWYFSMLLLFLVFLMILMSVAFLTLLERKLLGYIQERKGPNKLGFMGLVQPFSDAIKLLTKENLLMNNINYFIYLMSPIFMFILVIMIWVIYPFLGLVTFKNSFIYLICCLSLGVYGLLLSGWSSNSMYSMLGSIRSLAQSISYEVVLSLILLLVIMMLNTYDMKKTLFYQSSFCLLNYMWPVGLMMIVSLMAELNRTPFDFSEGESELVSGFNVEYSSGGFVLIFLSEYASILLVSYLFSMMFLGYNFYSIYFYVKVMFMSYMLIWVRGTFPRFRYDLLMYFCWTMILPLTLSYFFIIILYKIYKF